MRREKSKPVRIILICLVSILLGYSLPCEVRAAKTFVIGAVYPMTGSSANYGRVFSRGAITAIDQINAAGGVAGYNLKLEIVDFKNVDVNLGVTGVRKLITIDKASALLATYSAIILGIQPIAAKSNVVMINGAGFSPKLVNLPYLHTIRATHSAFVPAMAKYFWKMGIRRLAVIHVSDPAGTDAVQGLLIPMWTKMGGTIVAVEPHEAGLTDFGPHMSRIKASNPDAVYDISTGTEMAYIAKAARELGLTCPVHVPDWNHDYQAIAGKTSENVYCCNDLFDAENPNPLTQRFVKDFEKRWSEPTDFYSANQYDGVHIIAELIKRVVAKGGNPLDGAQLESAIWDNPRFDTVYGGKLELLKDGTVKKMVVISKIVGGKLNVMERVGQE